MRRINKIIIHCSATKEGRDVTVEDIDRWHRVNNGWKCIGYHYVIYRDGSVHEGRPVGQVGAHCAGFNTESIGVCYVGGLDVNGKPKDTRTPEQRRALVELVKELQVQFGIDKHGIFGHREFAAKACPCFDVKKEFRL